MNIQKLKNGKFRVREMYNGKTYSKNYDYRPTQKEIRKDMQDLIGRDYYASNDTFINSAKTYIDSKSNILSHSTLKNYDQYMRSVPKKFANTYLSDINKIVLQNLVNDYAKLHSSKSARNFYGFVSAVVYTFTDKRFKVILPPKIKREKYIPTLEDVKLMINLSDGTPYDIALLLASYGLRIGEIIALTLDDVEDGIIKINKSAAYVNHKRVIKPPKTFESNRIIKVPLYITNKIKKEQRIYNGCNTAINEWLYKVQDENKLPHFSIHKFRHFFASELHNKNVPNKVIQKMGGWSTDVVLKTVYQHAQDYEVIDIFGLDLGQKFQKNLT